MLDLRSTANGAEWITVKLANRSFILIGAVSNFQLQPRLFFAGRQEVSVMRSLFRTFSFGVICSLLIASSDATVNVYGHRRGPSLVAAQSSIVPVYPTTYQTPALGGDWAVTGPSNTGHEGTGVWASNFDPAGQLKSCRWFAFQPVSGQITRITLKFDWATTGTAGANVSDTYGYASASASFQIWYSTDNGSSATYAVSFAESASVSELGQD